MSTENGVADTTRVSPESRSLVNAYAAAVRDEMRNEGNPEAQQKVKQARAALESQLEHQRAEIERLQRERDEREYDDADMKKLGEWVQANLNHHAGLSWSDGIAREIAALRARAEKAEALYAEALDTDKAMVAVWKATIERDSRDIERAAVELDVYEFRTFALLIVRRWLGKSKEIIR